jgi:hypothetical protein
MLILEKILRAKLFFSYNAAWTKALKSFLLQKRYERIFIFIGAWIINFSAFPPIIYMFQEYTRRITRICCHSHISLFYTEHFFWWKGLQSHIYALICCFIGQDSKKWSKTSCKNLWHFKTFFSLSIFSCWYSSNILKTWHWYNGIMGPVKRVNMG